MLFPADQLDLLVQLTRHSLSPVRPKKKLPLPIASCRRYNSTTKFAFLMPAYGTAISRSRTVNFTTPSVIPASRPSKYACFSTGSFSQIFASRPDEALVIRGLDQFPVQPRRTHFQNISRPRNQIFHVQDHAQLLAHPLAILVSDTQPFRILRAGQPVNVHTQHALLANLPFDVEDLEAQRACHPLSRLSNLFQLHSIPTAIFSFVPTAGLKLPALPTASSSTALRAAPGFPVNSPTTAGTTGIDAPASRHPSRPTKKWACAHWLMRPVWKQPSIISRGQKRKKSRNGLAPGIHRTSGPWRNVPV